MQNVARLHSILTLQRCPFEGAEFCKRQKRRALDQDVILLPDDGNSFIFLYDPLPFTADEKSFPTPTGKTEKSARSNCNEAIRNSTIGKACLDTIKNFTIDSFVNQCVVDTRVSATCIQPEVFPKKRFL